MELPRSPPRLETSRMRPYSSQILTLIKITTCVPPPGRIASLRASPDHKQANMAKEQSLGSRPQTASDQTSFTSIHYSSRDVRPSETSIIDTRILLRATQVSDMRPPKPATPALLQLDITIPAIHESNYATRSCTCYKHYNTPISMWAVMNSG